MAEYPPAIKGQLLQGPFGLLWIEAYVAIGERKLQRGFRGCRSLCGLKLLAGFHLPLDNAHFQKLQMLLLIEAIDGTGSLGRS